MSCLPGMPCYDAYRIAFPFSCENPCEPLCFTSDRIIYNGPNLACTGIQSQDNLEVALQKIDDRMCSDEFISHIIVAIENNPVLKEYFCQLVSTCSFVPTTTTSTTTEGPTTTSTSSTTTTTTTAAPIPPGTYSIGDLALGGRIAYILQPGDPGYDPDSEHGLVATISDIGAAEWGCFGTPIIGADGTALGTGYQNTIDIITWCTTSGIAAKLCNDLVEGGYSDWYLPSNDELNKLYLNRVAIGGFVTVGASYWSSSEFDVVTAWNQFFGDGGQSLSGKDTVAWLVRPIRSF